MNEYINDSPQTKQVLVVDKSFLHATGVKRFRKIADAYDVVVPSAFYYESFRNDAKKMRSSLMPLAEFRRLDIPELLKLEIEQGAPLANADAPRLSVNPSVFDENWRLSDSQLSVLDIYYERYISESLHFWQQINLVGVPGFSSDELKRLARDDIAFLAACDSLRDVDRVRNFAQRIDFPHASSLCEEWLHFRYYQVYLLHSLVLTRRAIDADGQMSQRKLEHDLLDLQYLILGLHVGNLATNEISPKLSKASMGWRFKLLRPNGNLIAAKS